MSGSDGTRWWSQLLQYAAVGWTAFLTDMGSFLLLTELFGIDGLIANPFSRALGGWVCFLVNKVWTFDQGLRARFYTQLGRFWVVFFLSLGLSEALLAVGTRLLGLSDPAGKLAAEALVFVFNFVVLRSWAFR